MWYKTNYDQFSDSEEQQLAEWCEKRQKLKSEESKMQDRQVNSMDNFKKLKSRKKKMSGSVL